jgi:ABC-type multidrug transport system ATPase subunit
MASDRRQGVFRVSQENNKAFADRSAALGQFRKGDHKGGSVSKVIVAENLVKRYGPRLALRDVSFSIEEGEIVGLLGPNGSGKSSIFRILTGYLKPTAGTVSVAGYDVFRDSLALRRQVGYVHENAPLYDHMRVVEYLRFMAQIKGVERRHVESAVASVIDRLKLDKVYQIFSRQSSHAAIVSAWRSRKRF